MKLSPRSQALAFRVWHYCQGVGWDCTADDVAEALDVSSARVKQIVARKGWKTRLRSTLKDSERLSFRALGYSSRETRQVDTVFAFSDDDLDELEGMFAQNGGLV